VSRQPFAREPRAHRLPSVVRDKLARLDDEDMAQLSALARRIGARYGDVPWVDPASGRIRTRVLCLVESPGPMSARTSRGSGIISVDNDDQTAANNFRALAEAGPPRHLAMNWNAVPWHLDAVRRPTAAEIREAVPWLVELLRLLRDLRVVV
jgi:hypothetical protein